jgi:hypothetical protein
MKPLTAIAIILAMAAAPAEAAPLAGDSNAIVSGTQFYQTARWSALVQYAVYAPGAFDGLYPPAGDHYTYAYQIFNSGTSDVWLSGMSIAVSADMGPTSPTALADWGQTGGVAPILSRLVGDPPTSVDWWLLLPPGTYSQVLLVAAEQSFAWRHATVTDGGMSDLAFVPAPAEPMPEPATALLLLAGAGLLLRARKH